MRLEVRGERRIKSMAFILILFTIHCSLFTAVHAAEVLERIVAIVNNEVVLLSEYEEALRSAEISGEKVNGGKVLNDMIDRILLVEQAKRLRLGRSTDPAETVNDDMLIKEYIERRIKAFIHVPIDDIESYYTNNRERFAGKAFYEVKDEIEDLLTEGELKTKLAEHIEELRKNAYVRVQLLPAGLHRDVP